MRPIDADALLEQIGIDSDGSPGYYGDTWQFIKTIENAPTLDMTSEWIPCSERLPEYRELVIITTRDLRVRLAYLDSIYDNHTDDLWDMPLDNAECALWNAVAWMPLPNPYVGRSRR